MTEAATCELTLERVPDLATARIDWTRLAARAGNAFGTWERADARCQHLGADAQLAVALARRPTRRADRRRVSLLERTRGSAG